jgi:hypothetical protein
MIEPPEDITVAFLKVVVMPNGEIICKGKTIGWFNNLHEFLNTFEQILEKND